jgi:hypothetical protein
VVLPDNPPQEEVNMATKQAMVTAVFRDRTHAQEAFDWLHSRGYTADEINVLMSDATRARYFPTSSNEPQYHTTSQAAEGLGIGGAIGTAIGAGLAAVAAIGTSLALPGIGVIIAGPLAAAFAGGGAGAVAGGIIGWLVGLGVAEPNARAYEEALRQGGVILGVVPHTSDDANDIMLYFEKHHGESVYYG